MITITVTLPDDINTELVEAICANNGYAEIVPNPQNNGAPMANPLTPGQFAQQELVKWGMAHIQQYRAKQVQQVAADAAQQAADAQVAIDPSVVQVSVT